MTQREGEWSRQRVNPILVKCARSRMRWPHLLSWGIVVFTITGFFATFIYLTMTERDVTDSMLAARTILGPVVIIQAVILMLSGTGAVASGMARERMKELTDYHRMTPMSAWRKLIGFLFGLASREYFLFALTLPFVVFAVIAGEFPILKLLHFYSVFFSSVLVYHLLGLCAGMVAARPYFALLISQGAVFVLYFILPQLSQLGITFFEFLTIRPTFYGLVLQEINEASPAAGEMVRARTGLDGFRDVPVFDTTIHPTLYSFLVQSFLIVMLIGVLLRSWVNEQSHLFSKLQAFLGFTVLSGFVIASVWAMLHRDDLLPPEVLNLIEEGSRYPATDVFSALLMLTAGLLFVAAIGFADGMTPTRLTIERGVRRALKLGRSRPSLNSDAASGLLSSLGMCAVMLIVGGLVVYAATDKGDAFDAPPPPLAWLPLAVAMSGMILFAQGLHERFGRRMKMVGLFVVWVVPFLFGIIIVGAFENEVEGTYVCMPCPVMVVLVGVQEVLSQADFAEEFRPDKIFFWDIEQDARAMMVLAAILHGGLGIGMQIENWRHRRAISTRERAAWADRVSEAA